MYNENFDNYQEKIDVVVEEKKPNQKKQPSFARKATKLVGGALVFGLVAGLSFQGINYATKYFNKEKIVVDANIDFNENTTLEDTNKSTIAVTTSTNKSDNSNAVSEVAKNVMPSIVSINCSALSTEEFFGRVYQQPVEGSGSGIIIGQNKEELLIATNNHVVSGDNAKVEVVFGVESEQQETVSATIKGTDSNSDLAVISVKLSDLSENMKNYIRIATLGNSDEIQVGEMAIAIGNALGYGQSVTVGYISAKNREVSIEDATMTLIQTDAAINPGNSGGALLNAAGEVIGINSAKLSSTEIEGIGYAIPISEAIPIITELMNREELSEEDQGYLGIVPRDVPDAYVERYQMPKGIYIMGVTEDSPAQKAGLQEGMIITSIDGKTLTGVEDLQEILTYKSAGTTVKIIVKVLENGEYVDQELEVVLGNKPSTNE